jgi:hypothetical protein
MKFIEKKDLEALKAILKAVLTERRKLHVLVLSILSTWLTRFNMFYVNRISFKYFFHGDGNASIKLKN